MRKAIIISSVPSMIAQFNMDNIKILQSLEYEVHVASNFNLTGTLDNEGLILLNEELSKMNVKIKQVDFSRGMGSIKGNLEVYKQLKKIFSDENYDLIHCHSPIGGALGRLAARNMTARVIYTAHGFQFFKGGPKKDWIIFFPIEKYLAKYTDDIITINEEDYQLAKKFNKDIVVYKIPGVGIDFNQYQTLISKEKLKLLRKELGIPTQSKIMISVGELSKRKNHITGIRALAKLNQDIYYLVCGIGEEKENLVKEAKKLGVSEKVKFLNYVQDKTPYFQISDIGIFLSRREGLGLAGLECMAAGLPLISSNIGGIKDYTENEVTGFVIQNPMDYKDVSNKIAKLLQLNTYDKIKMCEINKEKARQYDIQNSHKSMSEIYLD